MSSSSFSRNPVHRNVHSHSPPSSSVLASSNNNMLQEVVDNSNANAITSSNGSTNANTNTNTVTMMDRLTDNSSNMGMEQRHA